MLHETGIFTPGTGAYRGRPDPICTPPKFNSKNWKLMMKIKTSYVCFWGKLGPIFRGKLAVFRGVVATSPPYLPMVKTHELMRCQENELAILKLGARRGDPWRLGFLGLAWNLPICIAMNGLDSHGINVVGKYSVSFLYRWWCFRYLWNFHPDYLGGKFDPHVVFVCFCSPGLVQPPTRRKNVLMMRPGGRMWFVWKGR